MKRIGIIGGGISGLSAAYHLELRRRRGAQLSYQLFEASSRLGGVLQSESAAGFLIEGGAESFLTQKLKSLEIFRQLGIEDQLIASNDAQRETYILVSGSLVPLPKPMHFFVPLHPEQVSPDLFSSATKSQFAEELKLRPGTNAGDESAASFIQRHFGAEFVERIADPMLMGIYGGASEALSAQTVLPWLVEMERSHGSVMRALQSETIRPTAASIFTSLRRGMQQLVDSIAAQLVPESISLKCPVHSVAHTGKDWQVSTANGTHQFDALVLALPAHSVARLLDSAKPELAKSLAKIPYTSSVTVSLGFAEGSIQPGAIPKGFGFLVPRTENRRLLACTFSQQKFPARASHGAVLLRAFFGGARDPEVLTLADSAVADLALRELSSILGFGAKPSLTRVYRWPAAMPQYAVGHLDLLAEIERQCSTIPNFALAGNFYRGVGVPDCILSGKKAAEQIAD